MMRRLWVQLDAGRPSECTPHPTPADPSLPPPADPSHLLCLPPSPGLRPGRLSYLQGGELSADPWWSERRCLQASSPAPVPEPPPASHPCWQAPFPKPAHNPPLPFPGAHPPLRPLCLAASQETHMAGVASSGARIRVPSFSRWQNSSLICTPGYGEAPDGGTGWGLGGEQTQARDREARLCSLAIEGSPRHSAGQRPVARWALSGLLSLCSFERPCQAWRDPPLGPLGEEVGQGGTKKGDP